MVRGRVGEELGMEVGTEVRAGDELRVRSRSGWVKGRVFCFMYLSAISSTVTECSPTIVFSSIEATMAN